MAKGRDVCDTSKWEAIPIPKKVGVDVFETFPPVTYVQVEGGWHLQGVGGQKQDNIEEGWKGRPGDEDVPSSIQKGLG